MEPCKIRCIDLQKLLEVSNSPQLANLDLRNSLEHIDERFDEYLPEPPCTIAPFAIASVGEQKGEIVISAQSVSSGQLIRN